MSLFRTLVGIGLNPLVYFRDLMLRVGSCDDVRRLTPHGWREHFLAEVDEKRRSLIDELQRWVEAETSSHESQEAKSDPDQIDDDTLRTLSSLAGRAWNRLANFRAESVEGKATARLPSRDHFLRRDELLAQRFKNGVAGLEEELDVQRSTRQSGAGLVVGATSLCVVR